MNASAFEAILRRDRAITKVKKARRAA